MQDPDEIVDNTESELTWEDDLAMPEVTPAMVLAILEANEISGSDSDPTDSKEV